MEAVAGLALILAVAFAPSNAGIIKSIKIKSGWWAVAIFTASAPSAAHNTRKPARLKANSRRVNWVGSSSTHRMVGIVPRRVVFKMQETDVP